MTISYNDLKFATLTKDQETEAWLGIEKRFDADWNVCRPEEFEAAKAHIMSAHVTFVTKDKYGTELVGLWIASSRLCDEREPESASNPIYDRYLWQTLYIEGPAKFSMCCADEGADNFEHHMTGESYTIRFDLAAKLAS